MVVAPEAQVRSAGPHTALQTLRDGDQHLGITVRHSSVTVLCGLTLSQKRWHLLPCSMLTGLTRRPLLSASPQARGWSQWKSACASVLGLYCTVLYCTVLYLRLCVGVVGQLEGDTARAAGPGPGLVGGEQGEGSLGPPGGICVRRSPH